jgi:hypothetical protein
MIDSILILSHQTFNVFLSCMGFDFSKGPFFAHPQFLLQTDDFFFFVDHRTSGRSVAKPVMWRFLVGVFVGFRQVAIGAGCY